MIKIVGVGARIRSAYTRNTVVEVLGTTVPASILILAGTIQLASLWRTFGLFIWGSVWLTLVIWTGRSGSVPVAVVDWPRPGTRADVVVTVIAYDGVLLLGTFVAQLAWEASGSLAIALVVSGVLPVWFLKHVHFLVLLDEG